MKRIVLALTLTALLASSAFADVVKTVSEEYYTVQGTSPKEIFNNLKKNSPLNKGMDTYQAHTQTRIRYKYKWRQKGNKCTLIRPTIYLHLTYKYPRLAHSVDYRTRKWWKNFITKLEEHELIHGQISSKAAHALDDALRGFETNDCESFKRDIKAIARRIVDKMKADQKEYDRITEHGLKQSRNMGRYP